jgi:hypothetical protein
LRALLALALCAAAALAQGEERTLERPDGQKLTYSVLDSASAAASARSTATQILTHLAAGRLEEAAALSNAPQRRYEVLRDYRASVGEDEFKRVFAQYLGMPIVAEIAIGPHRLIIWDLAEAAHHLAGQYYVEVDGRFLLDDVPSAARADLRRVLLAYRKPSPSPSGKKD